MDVKLSIIIPVLNSHEILRRQILHWQRIGLPDDCELIYMDDGSYPPLTRNGWDAPNFHIIPTFDTRPWTWAVARNLGAKLCKGEYVLMTDLDYIISRTLLDTCRAFTGDRLAFKREFGVLDADGNFTQDIPTLLQYGLLPERVPVRGVSMPPHPNNFCMRKDVYWMLGGYREDCIGKPYPQGEDRWFKKAWLQAVAAGKAKECDMDTRPMIYMFPNGQWCGDVDHNPFGLFHDLSRKSELNESIFAHKGPGVGYSHG